ncbi:S8 family serine peptidase [Actinomadura opuntiae]|uniref:S8 family serine peptidase n=1 Tax=Actinomadura sp. OS1-43 TaxID=604315 RepID=UPI00255B0D16|nr:S8 family serine peptidase [Actinomadura sp. OS1-43]MDL4819043.1 S8 family serine peptidase [Actinomadura sp. OS1-43]
MLTGTRARSAVRGRRAAASALLAAALTGAWLPLLPSPARADDVRSRQRGVLNELGMDAAWKITKGRNVTVAVVDSGVDPQQKDIAGSVTVGPNMLAAVDGGSRPAHLHGTGMASLIAGHGHGPGGGDGVIGLAPEARILAIRVIGEKEDPSFARYRGSREAEDAVAKGIRYAADHGADVINLSLGKDDEIPAERDAIGYAIGKGVVVVSAVGNDGDDQRLIDGNGFAPYSYPASYPGVIAVAATQPSHARAPFSNRNLSVVVSAPGAGLPVAGPGGEYFLSDGTSDASALVSGVAALIRAKHPKMAPALVSQALVEGARFGPQSGYDPDVGFGEVNAPRALTAADSLARGRPASAAGKPGAKRFGDDDPGPVTIIDRPAWVTPTVAGIILIGVAGVVGSIVVAVAFHRRHPRFLPAGSVPAPAGPPGGFMPRNGPPYAQAPYGGVPAGAPNRPVYGSPAPQMPGRPGAGPPGAGPPAAAGTAADTPRQPSQGAPAFAPPDQPGQGTHAFAPPDRPGGGRPSFAPPDGPAPGAAGHAPPDPAARPSFGAPEEPSGQS